MNESEDQAEGPDGRVARMAPHAHVVSRARGAPHALASPHADVADLVLAMDLGGTKALSGLFRRACAGQDDAAYASTPVPEFELRQRCDDFPALDALLDAFFAEARRAGRIGAGMPVHVCIAVAGPVQGARARLTNRPWLVDADALMARFGFGQVRLFNDFAAAAAGVEALGPDALCCLQPGQPDRQRPRAVLGPGTGLGVALMVPQGQGWRVIPGEGGHVGFAPRSALEIELWQFLFGRDPRVDAERLLCGPGLSMIDAFLRMRTGDATPPRSPEAISACAASGEPCAGQALDLFAAMLGAFAGDVALLAGAQGGVYVAGGMSPKVLDARRSVVFMDAFRDKGGHAAVVAQVPVHLVMDTRVGLLGAARLALTEGPVAASACS